MHTTQILCQLFIDDNDIPKYFFGTRFDAPLVIMRNYPHIKIAGIIDEMTQDKDYNGIPYLHSLDQIPAEHKKTAIVCNTVLGRYKSVKKRLDKLELKNFWYCSLSNLTKNDNLETPFWNGFKSHYQHHKTQYQKMIESFADDLSRDTLLRLINFRLTGNEEYMSAFTDNEPQQYWEDFLGLQSDGIFVDLGCYDGETSLEYIKQVGKYKRIYIFEPDKQKMEVSKQNLKSYDNITYCPVGAWNKKETLHFYEDGRCSTISQDGETIVEVDAIDNYIKEANGVPMYIKMDIEGAEKQAIEGARNTIETLHPTLAISIYHRGGDYLELYNSVMSIRHDYKVYVRHYLSGIMETIMYFVPC